MYIMSPDCFDTVFLSALGDALKSFDLNFQPLEIVSRLKWMKITPICLIWDQIFRNLGV